MTKHMIFFEKLTFSARRETNENLFLS